MPRSMLQVIDVLLLLYFVFIAASVPLIDGQLLAPRGLFPESLVQLKEWYVKEYGDYLMEEKPLFFFGLLWLQMLFQWPTALMCIVGILYRTSWLPTACVIYGASVMTSTAAILGELIYSGRASQKLVMMYCPFMVVAVISFLRGLVRGPSRFSPNPKQPGLMTSHRKRA